MTDAKQMPVPEDLKQTCPLCTGVGSRQQSNFRSAGEMDAGGEPQWHTVTCYLCKGSGKVWALDQQEMAKRIARLESELEQPRIHRARNERVEAENAALKEQVRRLSEPVNDEEIERQFQEWGKSSGVVTDFSKCSPLPVSGAQLYSRETSIAWQAFRYAFVAARARQA